MTEPLLLVEPRGHATGAFARLKADRLRSQSDVRAALGRHGRRALWIAPSAPAIQLLVQALPHQPMGDQRLLSLEVANGSRHGLLHVLFRIVVSADEGVRLLPMEELAEALSSAHRPELFIGVAVEPADAAVILYRG